ncbi:MAG TPA: hypothetical protein VIC08_10310 [Cellvibrionaceae bacterium]
MIALLSKPISLPLTLVASCLLAACGSSDNNEPIPNEKPAAVTVSASVATKSLTLSWTSTAGASHYRVYHNSDGSSGYQSISDNLNTTSYTTDLAVHLMDWENTRYMVEACNNAGCTPSADILVSDEMLDAIGYLKPSVAATEALFGFSTALSADGTTLAVGAPRYNLPQQDNESEVEQTGAVFLFTAEDTGWTLQQTLINPSEQTDELFGYSLALSDDGSVLAIGVPNDSESTATSVGFIRHSGAAYVYRKAGNEWQQESYLKASNAKISHYFGLRVALAPNGNRLAVSAPWEGSNAAGVNGDQNNNSIHQAGAVYVFNYENDEWLQDTYMKPSTRSRLDQPCFDPRPPGSNCYERSASRFGMSLAFADDGTMLAVGAPGDTSDDGGINGSQTSYRAKSSGAVHILRLGDEGWEHTDYIKAAYPRIDDQFGYSLSLSADGTTLLVGSPYEDSSLSGAFDTRDSVSDIVPPEQNSTDSGAVHVFNFSEQGWQQTHYLKSEAPVSDGYFGWHVAIAGNGEYLAVGSPRDRSNARGISDNWDDTDALNAGATFLYQRQANDDQDWALSNYIKASNTGASDTFGRTLAISHDGKTLAISATGEDSNATGVDGNQLNNDSSNSGAVYLY